MHITDRIVFFVVLATYFFGLQNLWADVDLSDLSYTISDSKVTITDCDTLASGALVIPSTIESFPVIAIGDSAFQDCSDLTSASIPEGVESIGERAFYKCSSLSSVSMPDSLTSLGPLAFTRSGLISVTVPGGVQSVSHEVFSSCASLLTATFEEGVESLGDQLFLGAELLESVVLPSTLTSFEAPRYASRSRNYLYGTFSSTPSLKSISVAAGNTVYASSGGALYSADYSVLLRVPIGLEGVLVLHDSTISNSFYAFEECALLTEVSFGDAFQGLSGENLISCDLLASFSISLNNTYLKVIDGVLYSFDGTELVACPPAKTGFYAVEDHTKEIHAYAFFFNQAVTTVTTPDSLEAIGEFAFYGSELLATANIQGVLTSLPDSCFRNCGSLSEVTLSDTVVTIEQQAFLNCSSLKLLSTAGLIAVGNAVFSNCSLLTAINLDEGLVELGASAFSNTGFTTIDLPSTLEIIGDGAFSGVPLVSIDLPAALLTIGEEAFVGCEELTAVTIPGSVTYIAPYAFYDTYALSFIEFSEGIQTIHEESFAECYGLEYVVLPSTLTTIESYAFGDCEALKGILFKGDVPTIVASDSFENTDESLTLYYYDSASGWSATLVGTPTLAIAPSQYPAANWMMKYGYAPVQDANVDTNDDGLSLLMAYALGLDPTENNGGAMPQVALTDAGAELAYYAGSSGLIYRVEVSYDLDEWTDIGVSQGSLDGQSIRTASIDRSASAAFLRLSVEIEVNE